MKLYLVPTPIGNLKDITFRAVEILKEVNLILAEDTRQTGKLLKHYNISAPMASFHQNNEHKVLQKTVDAIDSGQTAALVSDAGTPGISDPGFLLVRECIKNNIPVEALPGATAFVPALVASGLPCERFCFEGFLPVKKGRQSRIQQLANEERTMVFYESPHRIVKTLQQLAESLGQERQACIAREITKLHEEIVRGTLAELAQEFENRKPKGEFVLIIAGK